MARRRDLITKPVRLIHASGTFSSQSGGTASIVLDVEGEHLHGQASGTGPIDAIFRVIQDKVPHPAVQLSLFEIVAKGDTSDAEGQASVVLTFNGGGEFEGVSSDRDILIAAGNAYLAALNSFRNFDVKRRTSRHGLRDLMPPDVVAAK